MSTTIYTELFCQFCSKPCKNKKFYNKHINVCANNPSNIHKKFKCNHCNFVYLTNANLVKHNNTCTYNISKKLNTCIYCNFETYSNSGISIHIEKCIYNPKNKEKYNKKYFIKNDKVNKDAIFLDNKYTDLYYKIINSVTNEELLTYCENHHIIPRSMGGTDDSNNIIRLSARKHYICHLLLTKMVSKSSQFYYKMVYAIMMMQVNPNGGKRYNSKVYDKLKQEFSKLCSENNKGENNPSFGSKWIYNPITLENKKIKGNIPDGWLYGRKQKKIILLKIIYAYYVINKYY